MTMSPKQSLANLRERFDQHEQAIRRYAALGFVLFVAALYGFVLLRINTLSQAQPSQDAITSQVKAARAPHLDQSVISQLKSLQDNSVSVQSLFNDARNNPFQ